MASRWYEDLDVGCAVRFGHYPVTHDEVLAFAKAYDPQPFHLSDEGAAGTHFGRMAASGWHTCAMTMAMMVEEDRPYQDASLGSPGLENLQWKVPVYPGDTLSCERTVLEKRPSGSRPGIGIAKTEVRVFNQDAVMVMSMVAVTLVRMRPA